MSIIKREMVFWNTPYWVAEEVRALATLVPSLIIVFCGNQIPQLIATPWNGRGCHYLCNNRLPGRSSWQVEGLLVVQSVSALGLGSRSEICSSFPVWLEAQSGTMTHSPIPQPSASGSHGVLFIQLALSAHPYPKFEKADKIRSSLWVISWAGQATCTERLIAQVCQKEGNKPKIHGNTWQALSKLASRMHVIKM